MTPFKFEESDRVLKAGDNPSTGDLHIVTAIDPELPEGFGVIVSCWQPSTEEVTEFLKTGRIYIGVMCDLLKPTQPPIYAMGLNPFKELGWRAIQYRRGSQRMFKGKVNIMDLYFENDGRRFSMTVSGGENSFTLEEVVELMDDGVEPVSFDYRSKEYFKAWEILSAKYKEI